MLRKISLILFMLIPAIFCFAIENPTVTVHIMIQQSEQKESRNIDVVISEIADSPETAEHNADLVQKNIEEAFTALGIGEDAYFLLGRHSGKNEDSFFSSKNIQVTIPKNVDIDFFIKSVTEAGASGINDYQHFNRFPFALNGEEYPKDLNEAVKAAREKAQRIADAYNGNIGKVLEIKEMNYGPEINEIISIEVTYELIVEE